MIEGVVVLSEWTSMSALSGLMLTIGLICFILFAWVAIFNKEVISNNWFCVFVIGSIIGISLFVGSFFMPKDHGYKITLTNDANFSEIVKHYEIISVDNLILKVREQ